MPSATVLAGVWASSSGSSVLNTATFPDVSLVQGGWTDNDIGSPAIGGSADYDAPSDTYTISRQRFGHLGHRRSIQFRQHDHDRQRQRYHLRRFHRGHQRLGQGRRDDPKRCHRGVGVRGGAGFPHQRHHFRVAHHRRWLDESANHSPAGGPTPAPVGLELTRSGNSFTAYYSTDGINWIQVGPSQTVALNTDGPGGVGRHLPQHRRICTATFSSVRIGSSPPPGAGVYSAADQLFLNNLEETESAVLLR